MKKKGGGLRHSTTHTLQKKRTNKMKSILDNVQYHNDRILSRLASADHAWLDSTSNYRTAETKSQPALITILYNQGSPADYDLSVWASSTFRECLRFIDGDVSDDSFSIRSVYTAEFQDLKYIFPFCSTSVLWVFLVEEEDTSSFQQSLNEALSTLDQMLSEKNLAIFPSLLFFSLTKREVVVDVSVRKYRDVLYARDDVDQKASEEFGEKHQVDWVARDSLQIDWVAKDSVLPKKRERRGQKKKKKNSRGSSFRESLTLIASTMSHLAISLNRDLIRIKEEKESAREKESKWRSRRRMKEGERKQIREGSRVSVSIIMSRKVHKWLLARPTQSIKANALAQTYLASILRTIGQASTPDCEFVLNGGDEEFDSDEGVRALLIRIDESSFQGEEMSSRTEETKVESQNSSPFDWGIRVFRSSNDEVLFSPELLSLENKTHIRSAKYVINIPLLQLSKESELRFLPSPRDWKFYVTDRLKGALQEVAVLLKS